MELTRRCSILPHPSSWTKVFPATSHSKVKLVAKTLKSSHVQESKKASKEKAKVVVEKLHSMKMKEASKKKVERNRGAPLAYCDFPSEQWMRIRTNSVIEWLNWEIRRRTRMLDSFPDGNSVLMLVCAWSIPNGATRST